MVPHSQRSLALACSLALVTLFVLFSLLRPTPARAGDEPLALGSVSGTVKNAEGEPLAGIYVHFYHSRDSYQVPLPAPRVATDGAGNFRFNSVMPGSYYLVAYDPTDAYPYVFYPSAASEPDAERVNVSGNAVGDVQIVMPHAATLTGNITTTRPVTEASFSLTLHVRDHTGVWHHRRSEDVAWPTQTSATFSGLAPGIYRLCASYYNSYLSIDFYECHDNVMPRVRDSAEGADDIPLAAGESRTVSMTIGDIYSLQGVVTNQKGEGIAGAVVYATGNQFYSRSTTTNAQGHFGFGFLNSGIYQLKTIDPSGNYVNLAVRGDGIAGGDPFEILPQSRISVSIAMTTAGRITGRLSLEGGGPPRHAYVTPLVLDGSGLWLTNPSCPPYNCSSTTYIANTGEYTISGLAPNRYRVMANTESSYYEDALEAYYGGSSITTATDIEIDYGTIRKNIDMTLGVGAYEGVITGVVTADGTPQAGIEVGLFDALSDRTTPTLRATTDASGHYTFAGLPKRTYFVGFRDPQGRYASTLYSNIPIPGEAEYLYLYARDVYSDINVSLLPGGTISGMVRGDHGVPLAGITVNAIFIDQPGWLEVLPYHDGVTDGAGKFTITGLPPGPYFVNAVAPGPGGWFQISYYPVGPDTAAEQITVVAGQTIPNIDILFGLRPSAYLPLLNNTGD